VFESSEEHQRIKDSKVSVVVAPETPVLNLKRLRDADGRIGLSRRRMERRFAGFVTMARWVHRTFVACRCMMGGGIARCLCGVVRGARLEKIL
jgi:hypothetical protein